MKKIPLYIFLSVALFLISGCGTTIPFETIKTPLEINIDGSLEDWNSLVKFIPDENIATGFSVNGENIRLCLATGDKEKIRKITMAGLSLTFVPPDLKNKIVIKFPLAKDFTDMKPAPEEEPDFAAAEIRLRKLLQSQKELHVLDAEGDLINVHQFPGNSDYSFSIAYENGLLVYELGIPLGFGNQRATGLRAKAGDDIKVTIESGSFNKKESPQGQGMPGGGGGHQGGGLRGRNGGSGMPRSGEGRPDAPDFKPFKIELLLKIG